MIITLIARLFSASCQKVSREKDDGNRWLEGKPHFYGEGENICHGEVGFVKKNPD